MLADEEARERISVDAVRGVGPLRMIRRKVNRTAVAAGLGAGASSTGHLCSTECSTEVEGNTVLQLSTNKPPLMGKFGCLPTVICEES